MRCVVYARVSTDEQAADDKTSIPDQIKWAREYATAKGWDFIKEYIEPGVKGYTELEDREALTELLSEAKHDLFDLVLVYHTSRIARESDLILKFHRLLANDKVQVFCRNVPIEPVKKEDYYWGSNYTQQIMTGIAGVGDQQENVARSERVRSGFKGLAEHQRLVFAPYGYRKIYSVDTNGKRVWRWEINGAEAEVVEQIFDSYGTKGLTIRGVMRLLNDEKMIPPPQGKLWNTATIKNILNNPAYIGLIRWGRKLGSRYKQGRSVTGKQKRIVLSEDKYFIGQGDQPAIIDKTLFERVQKRLKERGMIPGRTIASPGLLTGLVKCGVCGKNAYHKTRHARKVYKSGKVLEYTRADYICQTYIRFGKDACIRHVMSANKIHQIVIEQISNKLKEALIQNKIERKDKSKTIDLESKKIVYLNDIKKLEEESKKLLTAYTKGVITLDDLGDERKRIEKDSKRLQEKVTEIDRILTSADSSKESLESIKLLAGNFETIMSGTDFMEKKEVIHGLIESVIINRDKSVHINYKGI